MQRILLLDNYDSFTYNLYHYLCSFKGFTTEIHRNDKISLEFAAEYDLMVLSPGPGLPEDAGILMPLIQKYGAEKKILGVCLGLQAIVQVYGGKLRKLHKVEHGKSRQTYITEKDNCIFKDIQSPLLCGRYHSWVADKLDFPAELRITAEDQKGEIMAIDHRTYKIHGLQFHPESIMTDSGYKIIENWLNC